MKSCYFLSLPMMKMKMFTLLIIRLYLSSKMRTFLPLQFFGGFDNTIMERNVTFWLLVSPRYCAPERNIAARPRAIQYSEFTARHAVPPVRNFITRAGQKPTKRTTQRKSLHSAENPLVFQLLTVCRRRMIAHHQQVSCLPGPGARHV